MVLTLGQSLSALVIAVRHEMTANTSDTLAASALPTDSLNLTQSNLI